MPAQRRTASASPFAPGTGGMPPVLAGRESEQRRLAALCQPLAAGRGASRPGVLIGPRGNGKTVLLAWLQRHVHKQKMTATWLTPDKTPTIDALAECIAGGSPADKRVDSLALAGRALEVEGSARLSFSKRDRDAPANLSSLMAKRARRRPFVLLVDEAHTLDSTVGRSLLNAAQEAASRAPFLLVLAGTPDLEDVLDGMSATFWSRCLPLGVGRLRPMAARSAIEGPLREANIGLQADALWKPVLANAQGYPYFVQIVGDALWKTAFSETTNPKKAEEKRTGQVLLDNKAVEKAINSLAAEKEYYYSRRYRELVHSGLLDCACRVAECFRERGLAHFNEISQMIASFVGKDLEAQTMQKLAHFGYIWASPDDPMHFQPGIPSLMGFLTDNRPH